MKEILVTGGMGYIGSHTVIELIQNGYYPVIVDNLVNSKEEVLNRLEIITGEKVEFHKVDVRDEKKLSEVFAKHNFYAVIHFAGLKAVGESVKFPDLYYDNNLGSTNTLLKVMEKYNVKRIVFSSSATVYGNPKRVPIVEDDEIGGVTNPYGETKYKIELQLQELAKKDPSWNIAILRYFNPIGAHESGLIGEDPQGIPNNLMPYITQVAVGKLPFLHVYGNDYKTHDGTGVRDYIHVVDLAIGHVLTLKKLEQDPGLVIYNLGTGVGTSVLDLVHAFEEATGINIPYKIEERRPGDIDECYASAQKAKEEIGFIASKNIVDACRDAWKWQKENPKGFDEKRANTTKINYSLLGADGNIELKGFNWKIKNPTYNLIIVTGMEEYAGRYDEFARYLNNYGFNVVCLDHYGQGQTAEEISCLGKTIRNAFSFSVENIHALANKLKEENGLPVYVMGHSMGSFITQSYIQKYSNDVEKAIIMGSNGPNAKTLFKLGALLTKIMVNDRNWNKPGTFFANLSFNGYKKHFPQSEFAWLSKNEENVKEYSSCKYCGYGSSNGFYYELLNGNAKLFNKKNIQNIRKSMPILVIAGEDDPVGAFGKGPRELEKMYKNAGINNVSLILYPTLRHEILNEDIKKDIYKDILDFLHA